MIFFDLRPGADTAQLHERVARLRFVFGEDDLLMVGGRDQSELLQLRIEQEVQRDQIGARFFER